MNEPDTCVLNTQPIHTYLLYGPQDFFFINRQNSLEKEKEKKSTEKRGVASLVKLNPQFLIHRSLPQDIIVYAHCPSDQDLPSDFPVSLEEQMITLKKTHVLYWGLNCMHTRNYN